MRRFLFLFVAAPALAQNACPSRPITMEKFLRQRIIVEGKAASGRQRTGPPGHSH
jgi:hypothetical protein